jgi:hypothetical protein
MFALWQWDLWIQRRADAGGQCYQRSGFGVRTAPPLGGGKRSSGAFSGSNARERFRGPCKPQRVPQAPLGPESMAKPAGFAIGFAMGSRSQWHGPTSPREGALQRVPAEIRWEGLRNKAPRTSVGAPSRGRARTCVCVEDGAKRMCRDGRPKKRRATDWQNTLDSNATE